MVRVAIAVIVAACGRVGFDDLDDAAQGPTPEAVDGYASGSRLKLMWYELEDGTRRYESVYDTLLDEVCYPLPWSDSVTRCSPLGDLTYYFLDAACTQPVAAFSPGASATSYVYELDWCTGFPRLLSVGSVITPSVTYSKVYGPCTMTSMPGWTHHAVTEVPADRYVTLTATAPTSGTAISLRSMQSPDGLVLPTTMHDPRIGDCLPTIHDPTVRCRPSSASGNLYGDASCTQSLGLSNCPTPTEYFATDQSCAGEVRPVGALHTGPTWVRGGSTCMSFTLSAPQSAYQLGPPIPLQDLTREIGSHPGRRSQNIYDVSGTARLRRPNVYDSVFDIECSPILASDGTLRCMPTGGITAPDIFADAGCTVAANVVGVLGQCGQAAVAPRLALSYTPTTKSYEVVEVGGPYAGPLYRGGNGNCSLDSNSTVTYFTSGARIEPTQFSSTTLITDP